jgi:hypothetical protein
VADCPIECIKFLDGKPVYMLSTIHGSDMSATCRRDKDTNEIIMKRIGLIGDLKMKKRKERLIPSDKQQP